MRHTGPTASIACALAVLGSAPAGADLVAVDFQIPGDGGITRDTETGLEWLDLTLTAGSPYPAQPAPSLAAAGWRRATGAEVCALLNRYVGALAPCPREEFALTSETSAAQFVSLFGITFFSPPSASAFDDTAEGGIATLRATGFAHGPASLTSSTAAPSGVVQLVTPLQIESTFGIFDNDLDVIGMTAALRLRFVPEPGRLLLLAAGALGLLLLGRRRGQP